jgi:hypothetical protein
MSYNSIAAAAQDADLRQRIAACFAQETDGPDQPEALAALHQWRICAAPGWGEAYESALAGGVERPGADPEVITDGQVLAAVQAILKPAAG